MRLAALILAALVGYIAWLLRDDPIWHSHSRLRYVDGQWVQEFRKP